MFNHQKNNHIQELTRKNKELTQQVKELKSKLASHSEADLYRELIGLPMMDFSNVGTDGMPEYYLKPLGELERKQWIVELASINENKKFQTLITYLINLFGNHALRSGNPDAIKLGAYSINGIRMLEEELKKASNEHTERLKPAKDFDPLKVLPELET